MKILKWIWSNLLFVLTAFLIVLIPLYPKIPLMDVANTWVYIRAEDFVIGLAILIWFIFFFWKKVSLETPLTIPIMLFWIIGGLATLHGVLVLFPTLANVYSNVAFLSFLRRIEYMSLFFIAYSSIKDKKFISYTAVVLIITLLLIIGYGFGQKYLGFPAYLTMNEEFAKGIPIQLSQLSRVPSTFAGHYDLAAYLVLVIPIMVSLAFGLKKIMPKIFLFITASLGFVLLFMTVSRVSFFVLLLSLLLLLILQKKRIIIISLLVLTFALLALFPSLLQRFQSTVAEVNVLVDARTGGAIGEVKEVPSEYFKDKVVKKTLFSKDDALTATGSAAIPYQLIPPTAALVIGANNSTGESLPQGTSYVNLPLSPVTKKVDEYFFQKYTEKDGVRYEEISVFYGDYLIKKAKAYDLSFTTRFQGEWPKTLDAFKRNIFLGSGYGSVSLAVDNNYLRILGESGMLGFIAFISIFIVATIYIKRLLPKVDSSIAKSFIIGFIAGSFGLILNAFLIDVFEASKIAFSYWLLMGVVIGTLHLYEKDKINLFKEFKQIIVSPFAIVVYIIIAVLVLYVPILSNYFVGDDFTWFKWVSDCCNNIGSYFTQANGFFYRPGTKIYFSLMYSAVWLNQAAYHFVSVFLHLSVSILLFLILKRISKNYILPVVSVTLFLVLTAYHEAIFWISSTGFLFNAFFILFGLLFFMLWKEKKKIIYLVVSLVSIAGSLLFHELGIVAPLLIILYDFIFEEKVIVNKLSRKVSYLILLFPILPYLGLRFLAQSHWFNGDYSYNILKLPYNFLGNTVGYLLLDLFGPQSLPLYDGLRNFARNHMLIAVPISLVLIVAIIIGCKAILKKIDGKEKKIVIFGFLFFLIALLPFLGLGNITSRYSYLSSAGFVILLALIFKKAYIYFVDISGKYVGMTIIIVIAIAYSMFQLFQLQKIQVDWKTAGQRSEKFLVSVERYAKDDWTRQEMQFYFVDMPIREGEAWVWPVGLGGAIWLSFENPNLTVSTASDINSAFDQSLGLQNAHVFKFDKEGNVDEVVRARDGQINLLNPPR